MEEASRRAAIEAHHNRAEGLATQALAGAEIRIFLEPDATVRSRGGSKRYIESLDLPHVIVKNGAMWAAQRNFALRLEAPVYQPSFFAYFTGADLFANTQYTREDNALSKSARSLLMSTGRYKALRWMEAPTRYETVYDSDTPEDRVAFVKAIHAVKKFRARIDFADGLSQVHPVFYPFYYPDSDRIEVQTEPQFFPEFMRRAKEELPDHFGPDFWDLLDHADPKGRERNIDLGCSCFSSYFRIFDHAEGQRIFDIGTDRRVTFERVRIFAES